MNLGYLLKRPVGRPSNDVCRSIEREAGRSRAG